MVLGAGVGGKGGSEYVIGFVVIDIILGKL